MKNAGDARFTHYYYAKNLQGDVVAVYRSDYNSTSQTYYPTLVASYEYDPWGKVISVKGSSGAILSLEAYPNHIAHVNPIRYRGYYYDNETGFYYLQSRYYDPAICRFINADARIKINYDFSECNMFSYCKNNAIKYADSDGYSARLVGIGAEFELDVGSYVTGVEVIVYWDSEVCKDGEPVVAVYAYDGVGVNLDELVTNPDYQKVVSQLTCAITTASCPDKYGKRELTILQESLFRDASISASIVGVFGYENFKSTSDYEGPFQTRSVSWRHAKVGYAYSDTGFAITVGATTSGGFHVSVGKTYYEQIA